MPGSRGVQLVASSSERERLAARHPRLLDAGFEVASPRTEEYNCVAWAVGEDSRWWSPQEFGDYYWPDGAPRSESVDAYAVALESAGFEPCDSAEFEPGYEKVAIYATAGGRFMYAARQLKDGRWASKLGAVEDIIHALDGLEGADYGQVVRVLRRRR